MNSYNTMENNAFLQTLEQLAEGKDLSAAVASEALEAENPEMFFQDLLQHGCSSGMVWSLIYYRDTHAFFDKHYAEIEALREEAEENYSAPLKIVGDLKNWLAWFAFEETAYKIANEWEVG